MNSTTKDSPMTGSQPVSYTHLDVYKRQTYDNLLRLIDDPDVRDPIKFLREREVVHFQRFGEALRLTQDHLDSKNFYAFNPSFDTKKNRK